jgi:acyl carrier protein
MSSPETLERIRGIVSTLFSIGIDKITPSSSPRTISAWDSMGQLTLVLELEQEFGLRITPDLAERMVSVGAVADMIDEYIDSRK